MTDEKFELVDVVEIIRDDEKWFGWSKGGMMFTLRHLGNALFLTMIVSQLMEMEMMKVTCAQDFTVNGSDKSRICFLCSSFRRRTEGGNIEQQ